MIERLFEAWVRKAVPIRARLSALSVPDVRLWSGIVGILDLDDVGAEHRELVGANGPASTWVTSITRMPSNGRMASSLCLVARGEWHASPPA